MSRHLYSSLCFVFCFLVSCNDKTEKATLFSLLNPSLTNIGFNNSITENDSFNIYTHTYMYNGAGVGVGDFNNDGLKDIFFAGNMVSCALYINNGQMKFEDISESSGISRFNRWCTGVSIVDINSDGFDDIYVSVADVLKKGNGKNLLFINNKDLTFTEMAAEYGLDDDGYSTQALFFDYDRDGDLDMYLLTNNEGSYAINIPRPKVIDGTAANTDRLYRNEGVKEKGPPVFKNVSAEAGILVEGHGLGVAMGDINLDGWPDIYVANDFLTNDLLWINNKNGTFTNMAGEYLDHQSMYGMGTDICDFNNDGLPDIIVLDMLPPGNARQKSMMPAMNYDRFHLNIDYGYQPQHVRNTLQMNNGKVADGKVSFSEIGQLSNVYCTDWSWAPLFADFDNDGLKDLFITNGYPKDITDLDYMIYKSSEMVFATGKVDKDKMQAYINQQPEVKVPNYIFKNTGELQFADMCKEWGTDYPSLSNGAIFSDLDNDGDLDLITNNINQEAFILQNNSRQVHPEETHYLKLILKGPKENHRGIGSKIFLKADDLKLWHEQSVIRGFKSSVDPDIHFGLGKHEKIDSLFVLWPDGTTSAFFDIPADTTIIADKKYAQQEEIPAIFSEPSKDPLLKEVSGNLKIDFKHEETDFIDFKLQPLLPHKYSQSGPAVACGDLNGDGLDDFVVGGSVRMSSWIFYQNKDGSFSKKELDKNKVSEDMGLLIFDADNDGDNDIYAASGSNEFYKNNENYKDRLYINDGSGQFASKPMDFAAESGSCVSATDFDKDGDLDLFVGGRISPNEYPTPPQSFLLENRNGNFIDITEDVASGLKRVGMVSAAIWTDFNNDGWIDLIVAGEWMPLTFYKNSNGKLEDVTSKTGLSNTEGWWNSIAGADFDSDGDIDYIVGNFGKNNKYKASVETPVQLYAKDFDNNGSIDPIQTYFIEGVEYPEHPRDAFIDQMNSMRNKFKDYASYAKSTFADVFDKQQLTEALKLKAVNLNTSYLENKGNGKFELKSLPVQAQLGPVFGVAIDDYNEDGYQDVLLTGKSMAMETNYGWQDALKGIILTGDGNGGFKFMPQNKVDLNTKEDSKSIARLHSHNNQNIWLLTSNRGPLQAFIGAGETKNKSFAIEPNDASAILTFNNGKKQKIEFYYGEGYLSQSSRVLRIPQNVKEAKITDFKGNTRSLALKPALAVIE